jgi:ribosomal protein S18 acetylase RimI-like enzyme
VAFEIRRLGLGDEEVVQRLSIDDARFEPEGVEPRERIPHTIESAREFLSVETNFQLAAFAEGEPVGQLIAYELIRRHGDGRMMFIYEIGVRSDYRRKRVGSGLLDLLRELCGERGIARAFLMTNESNLGAIAFYESLGARRDHDDEVVFDFAWT